LEPRASAQYFAALDQLREHPAVFACPCSRRELARGSHAHACLDGATSLDDPGVAWRVNTRAFPEVVIPDLVAEGFTVNLHREAPDFAIRKKGGRPSYQLACVVDDLLFGITNVGRGQDLLASTAAQSVLSNLLGYPPLFERARFLHHPLVADPAGGKLSKSAGAAGVSGMGGVPVAAVVELAEGWFSSAAASGGPSL